MCQDFRGMIADDASNSSLQRHMRDFFKEITTVRRLDFGPCPASLMTGAVDNMWRLEHLSAEFITSSVADQPAK